VAGSKGEITERGFRSGWERGWGKQTIAMHSLIQNWGGIGLDVDGKMGAFVN